jgi:hypothetical protein
MRHLYVELNLMKFVLPLFRSNIGLVLEMCWTSLSKFLKVPRPPQAGEGFKQFLTEFFEAFPDMCTTVEHIVAENNLERYFLTDLERIKVYLKEFHQPTHKSLSDLPIYMK